MISSLSCTKFHHVVHPILNMRARSSVTRTIDETLGASPLTLVLCPLLANVLTENRCSGYVISSITRSSTFLLPSKCRLPRIGCHATCTYRCCCCCTARRPRTAYLYKPLQPLGLKQSKYSLAVCRSVSRASPFGSACLGIIASWSSAASKHVAWHHHARKTAHLKCSLCYNACR